MVNRSSFAVVWLGVAALLSGCMIAPVRPAPIATATMIREGRAQGLDLEDPLRGDAAMIEQVDEAVGHHGAQEERLRYPHRDLSDAGYVNFQYLPERSLTARAD